MLLKLSDDEEIRKVFDGFKTADHESSSHSKSMPVDKLEHALKTLGISVKNMEEVVRELDKSDGDESGAVENLSLETFMRIVRRPSEVEQWIQLMPLAALLARSLELTCSKTSMDGLEQLQETEISSSFGLFFQVVTQLFRKRIEKLKCHKQQEVSIKGNPKYGTSGYKMVGGTVEDFHKGLGERMGRLDFVLLFDVAVNGSFAQVIRTRT